MRFEPESSTRTILFSLPFLVGYPLAISTATFALARKASRHNRMLAQQTRVDASTGLLNRPSWEAAVDGELRRFKRGGAATALLMVDIDHFKEINDRYGHLAGDEVIRTTAAIIQSCIREIDVPGRYGGDEFGVMLAHTGTHAAIVAAERIRQRVAETAFERAPGVRCTLSIGIAAATRGMEDVHAWISQADAALYQAKTLGSQSDGATLTAGSRRRLFIACSSSCAVARAESVVGSRSPSSMANTAIPQTAIAGSTATYAAARHRPHFCTAAALFLVLLATPIGAGVRPRARHAALVRCRSADLSRRSRLDVRALAGGDDPRARGHTGRRPLGRAVEQRRGVFGRHRRARRRAARSQTGGIFEIVLAAASLVLSWCCLNTMFALHYAHEYYMGAAKDKALEFPGTERARLLGFHVFRVRARHDVPGFRRRHRSPRACAASRLCMASLRSSSMCSSLRSA